MALQLNYTDRSGRLNKNAYLNIGYSFGKKAPQAIDIYVYASEQAYRNGKEPIDGKQRFNIDEGEIEEFFSLAKQQELGKDIVKLGYEFLKSGERSTVIPIDFSEAEDV